MHANSHMNGWSVPQTSEVAINAARQSAGCESLIFAKQPQISFTNVQRIDSPGSLMTGMNTFSIRRVISACVLKQYFDARSRMNADIG